MDGCDDTGLPPSTETDWPIADDDAMTSGWLGTVCTALVGLAGIIGTLWTGGRQRRHQLDLASVQNINEETRFRSAEKRKLYGRFLEVAHRYEAECKAVREQITRSKASDSSTAEQLDHASAAESPGNEWDRVWFELRSIRSEMTIVTEEQVASVASAYIRALDAWAGDRIDKESVTSCYAWLIRAMKIDYANDKSDEEKVELLRFIKTEADNLLKKSDGVS